MEKGPPTVFPRLFLYDLSRKIFLKLYSINWTSFIIWLPLLLEILGNMCIVVTCEPEQYCILRLSRQFQTCLFFLRKRFRAHKNKSHLEVYARMKNCCLCCLVLAYFCFVSWFLLVTCFCAREIFSSKKKKKKKKAGLKLSW